MGFKRVKLGAGSRYRVLGQQHVFIDKLLPCPQTGFYRALGQALPCSETGSTVLTYRFSPSLAIRSVTCSIGTLVLKELIRTLAKFFGSRSGGTKTKA